MTFVATDSLSELVWSPRNGLRIKHTVGSRPEKKPFLIWGAGPSNMVLLPSHNIGNKVDLDNITEEREVIEPPVTFSVEKEVDHKTVFSNASKICGDVMQTSKLDFGCECGSSEKSLHKGNQLEECPSAKDAARDDSIIAAWATELKRLGFSDQERGQSKNFSSEANDLNLDDGPVRSMPRDLIDVKLFESQVDGNAQFYPVSPLLNCNPPSESHASRMCESNGALMLNQSSQCKEYLDAETTLGEKSHNTMIVPSLNEKLEPSCQSEVLRLGKVVGDSSVGIQEGAKVEKEPLKLEGSDPAIKASPIRALALKGKGKYLFDVDMQDGTVMEDDDSYGSGESCNGSGFIPGGKKRILSFRQQLIVGTKRVKRLCRESPNSTASFTRYDSSFTNWMSTMIKGLPNSTNDTQPFVTLPLTHMVDESKCLKDHYFKPSNVGFQSIFRSLYQATSKFLDQGSSSPDNQIESCKKLEVLDNPCEPNNAIGSCEPPDTVTVKHVAGSSESPNQGMAGDKDSPSVQLKISKGNFSTSSHGCNANVFDLHLINSSGQEPGAEKAGSSHATFVKLKSDRSDGNGVGLPSEEKTARYNDPLSSLWVTRLGSEACSPTKPPINFKLNASGAAEANTDEKFIHNSQSHVNLLQDLNIVEYLEHSSEEPSSSNCKQSHDSSLVFEAHTSVESVELQKAVNPIIPSQNLKSSETMSSVLDKNLDAFKSILASDTAKKETFHSVTCIFCGLTGHGLRACPQVTKTELVGLLTKIADNVGAEVSPCLCIRCFQLNHWPIACPNVSLNKPNQLERSASQLDYCNSSQMKHVSETGKNLEPLDDKSHQIQSGKEKTISVHGEGSFKLPSISSIPDVNMEMNASTPSVVRVSTSILDKLTSSNYRETARRSPRLFYRCLSLAGQFPDMHEGIVKAVKGLRLSRLDILKWIASPGPISHLNGYYLRLRLGKADEGFGSTGYYVACITGFEGHELPETSKNSIPVMVRGMKCLVESHNISNQAFLEVELMAWWSSILRDGGKVPSEDDLRLKFDERRRLGL